MTENMKQTLQKSEDAHSPVCKSHNNHGQKVSVHQNTITNSYNFTNQDLHGMELNEFAVNSQASELKDAADVTSAL